MLMAVPPPPNKGEIREGKSEWEETVVLTNYSYNIFPHKLLKTYENVNILLGTFPSCKRGNLKLWCHHLPYKSTSVTFISFKSH